jgi:acyl carrier protein
VAVVGGEAEQQRLAAYLVMKDRATVPEAAELRRYLRTKLPEHMVPAGYWQIETVPLLPSGKVNRALVGRGATALVDSHDWVGPRTETEVQLAEIWRELLKVERVRVDESFFELGGHSLLVLQMTARIRRTMEVELPVRTVFESPTIAGLAQEVQKARTLGLKAQAPVLRRRQRTPTDPNREELLKKLDTLTPAELQSALQRLLEGKESAGEGAADAAD